MKNTLLSIFLVVGFLSELQAQFNDYKYVVIPKKFDGFSKENQYKTSTLIKYLFTQKGFTTVYDDKLPEDLQANRCLGLFVDLNNKSSMFTTKATLILKDCSNVDVFTTMQGRSKKKEYESSFAEAIENAFRSFDGITYKYEPKVQDTIREETVTVNFKNDIKTPEERSNPNRNNSPLIEQESTEERQYYKDNTPTRSDYKKVDDKAQRTVRQVATEEEQSFESIEPERSSEYSIDKTPKPMDASVMKTNVTVLYAQELSNGYQLVDSTPKIRMKMYKSSSPNVYIAESGTINGVVYADSGKWFFEYYNANELVTEELNIKF